MSARVALALGSGGARGYAHIGVINELERRGHQIVSVAGSSMGSVIGGMFAAGTLDEYTRWVLSLTQRGVLRELDPALSTAGVLSAERVLARMVEFTGDRRIEDLPIRFTAVAVDLLASREVWLDAGPLDRAIRASIGIPGVVTPVAVNGRLLVDGGVLNPVPVAATATSRQISSSPSRCRASAATPSRRHRGARAPTTDRQRSGGVISEPMPQRCSARTRLTPWLSVSPRSAPAPRTSDPRTPTPSPCPPST